MDAANYTILLTAHIPKEKSVWKKYCQTGGSHIANVTNQMAMSASLILGMCIARVL
jgi:hypothetical protein